VALAKEDTGEWRRTLPALVPGRYEVAVEVMDVPGFGSVRTTATVLVVDPATVDETDGDL
jgi:hypothetical protein